MISVSETCGPEHKRDIGGNARAVHRRPTDLAGPCSRKEPLTGVPRSRVGQFGVCNNSLLRLLWSRVKAGTKEAGMMCPRVLQEFEADRFLASHRASLQAVTLQVVFGRKACKNIC